MHYAQQLTEEIDTRRSAALTKVLNLASRNRELESVCCDMLPASIEPRPSGCVSSLLIPSLGAGPTIIAHETQMPRKHPACSNTVNTA